MKKQEDAGAPHKALDFLPDADEIEHTPIHGGVPVTLYVLVALLVSALVWAGVSEVDEVVTARGRLVTPYSNIVIQPIETAQIETMRVQVGQIVRKGQVLATLDPTFITADLKQLQDRHSSLDAQLRRLEAERSGGGFKAEGGRDERLQAGLDAERRANYQARLAREDEVIGRLKAAIETNKHDIAALELRVKSLRDIEAMNENLNAQRFLSQKAVLESREKRLEVERDLIVATNRSAELKRELSAAEAERLAFVKEWRQKILEELVNVQRDRDAVGEQLQKAERRNRLINIEAPEDGVVLEVAKRSPGSTVREAEPLFTLVPLNAPLEAEVQIDAKDIGFVKLGDPARVKIDAFPFQKHGTISGRLEKLNQDAFVRESATGQATGAYYVGRIALGEVKLINVDKPLRLLPGMSLASEIVVGKRTVLSYLVYPVIRTFDEAIQEP